MFSDRGNPDDSQDSQGMTHMLQKIDPKFKKMEAAGGSNPKKKLRWIPVQVNRETVWRDNGDNS